MSKEQKKEAAEAVKESPNEEVKLTLIQKLARIQLELKAPKNQRNNFGKYNYRSAEDILEAVKPLCMKYGVVVSVTDDIVFIPCKTVHVNESHTDESEGRIYVKATVTIRNCDDASDAFSTSAFAREEEDKKGMDGSQVTGAASSYARKYALNGMFAIDDTKDSDATNDHGKGGQSASTPKSVAQALKPSPKPQNANKVAAWKLFKSAYHDGEDDAFIGAQFKKVCVEVSGKEDVSKIGDADWDKILTYINGVLNAESEEQE